MKLSAGVLVYRRTGTATQFLLCHPGGPYWSNRDWGAWTTPKGLIEAGEPPLTAAVREFTEETGLILTAPLWPLTPIRQAGGKQVICWAAEQSLDISAFKSEAFQMEWPPKSGRQSSFPEIDRIAYFSSSEALKRVLPSQAPLIQEVLDFLG